MGIAIRTGSPLSLNLAEPVWKQLAGMALTPADITEVCDCSAFNVIILRRISGGMCA